jgi:hypothetical protein
VAVNEEQFIESKYNLPSTLSTLFHHHHHHTDSHVMTIHSIVVIVITTLPMPLRV